MTESTESTGLVKRLRKGIIHVYYPPTKTLFACPVEDPLLEDAANRIEALEAEVALLREALEFYADKDNHKMRREPSYRDRFSQNMKPGKPKLGRVSEDKGKRARAALGGKP